VLATAYLDSDTAGAGRSSGAGIDWVLVMPSSPTATSTALIVLRSRSVSTGRFIEARRKVPWGFRLSVDGTKEAKWV